MTLPFLARPSRRNALAAASVALLLMAGCASVALPGGTLDTKGSSAWSGRLSLRIESDPEQTFAALFELRGTAQSGDLVLTTPIGSTLASLHWAPGEATLDDGRQTRHFASVDALIEAATGAAIPVDALFGWLAGRDDRVGGYRLGPPASARHVDRAEVRGEPKLRSSPPLGRSARRVARGLRDPCLRDDRAAETDRDRHRARLA